MRNERPLQTNAVTVIEKMENGSNDSNVSDLQPPEYILSNTQTTHCNHLIRDNFSQELYTCRRTNKCRFSGSVLLATAVKQSMNPLLI